MGLSCRLFLLDPDDGLYRLPNTRFDRLLRDPACPGLPRFAGARVRTANVVVECLDRQPVRIVWTTFGFLRFGEDGRFDRVAFEDHQRAIAELAWAPRFVEPTGTSAVVDAASRFVAQGGRWKPSRTLTRRIEAAALGQVKCMRL